MKAFIVCGGEGRRLKTAGIDKPKALLEVHGKPLIHHQIERFLDNGITEIGFGLGESGDEIRKSVLGLSEKLEISLSFFQEQKPLGTGGSVVNAHSFFNRATLVVYGDILFDVKLSDVFETDWDFYEAGIVVRYTEHPEDSDLVEVELNNTISRILVKPHSGELTTNLACTGMFVVTNRATQYLKQEFGIEARFDLEREGLKRLVQSRSTVRRIRAGGFFRDIGSPGRLLSVQESWGTWLDKKGLQPTVLLDRDGVINKEAGYITSKKDFHFLPGAIEAISRLKHHGFQVFVVTNQPVIARGESTWKDLQEIHNYISLQLLQMGSTVNDFFVCPHHPDSGYAGEVKELKFACECRKPNNLHFKQIEKYFYVNRKKTVMIGDSKTDLRFALNSGIEFIGIGVFENFLGASFHNLDEASRFIVEREEKN